MIVGKAPMRVSFLGGGTDFPEFFTHSVGHVIGCSIQHSVYVVVNELPRIAEQSIRFTYRATESVNNVEDLKHPVLRATLAALNIDGGVNVGTLADVPGNSGLGSSSAFTVALLAAFHRYLGREPIHPEDVAREAIAIERGELQEPGGWQDQFHAAVGGLRHYRFDHGRVTHEVLPGPAGMAEVLSESMLLVPIGSARRSSVHARASAKRIVKRTGQATLDRMVDSCLQTVGELARCGDSSQSTRIIAHAVNRSWELKCELSPAVQVAKVASSIDFLREAGGLGAKLCGAGGSGFILLITEPGEAQSFNERVLGGGGLPARVSTMGVESWSL